MSKTPDIIGVLTDELLTDVENDSQRLISMYDNGDGGDIEVIDNVLIAICGYSLQSLKAMAIAANRYVED